MSANECEKDCKICKLEIFMNPSWREYLEQEFEKQYFKNIKSSLHTNSVIYPPVDQIFSFSRFFDIEDTKVVIIGQDPYHGKGQANGLAFSVNKGIKLPPSLRNILKEVSACDAKCGQTGNEENNENNSKTAKPLIKPNMDGDLVRWAKQGVLLLNDCLTVIENKPNSHKNLGWNTFTDKIIKLINTECKNVVFMLWGNFAQVKEDLIDNDKHLVLKTTHPSPFSCRKGFLGCRHFEIANKYLDENGKGAVCWHDTTGLNGSLLGGKSCLVIF